MEKLKKFKEADKIYEIINPYEERGRKLGREEGIEIGVGQGREEERIEIALKMLNEGLPIELITKVTKLSEQKIEELNSNS